MKNTSSNSIRPTLLAIAIAQALAVSGVQAATIEVNDSGDAGPNCTLRKAIESINFGELVVGCGKSGDFGVDDQISFSVSVATVSLSNGQLDINKDLSIVGGSTGVTINGNGSSRLLHLDESGTNISLDKLTLSGGSTVGSGGAIYALDVNLNLSNSTVSGNSASNGGGIHVRYSSVSLSNSTISENSALFSGGGILAFFSNTDLSDSSVSGNIASSNGGGIHALNNSSMSLSNSSVSGNIATRDGGGIHALDNSSVHLYDSSVSGNSALKESGGIHASYSSVSLSNSSVSGNSANTFTGGIFVRHGNVNLSNSTVSGNSASSFSGGIYANFSNVSLRNSTVSGNFARHGGGVYAWHSNVNLSNSTVSGNSADMNGGAIYADSSSVSLSNSTMFANASFFGVGGGMYITDSSSVSLSNSIIANSNGADCFSEGVITADNHNIIEDGSCATSALNVDPRLGPLVNNGGPTQTHALLAGSPAIDAGDSAVCVAPPVNNRDQRGEPRPIGSACDIGAYELRKKKAYFLIPQLNGKTFIFRL